MTNKSDLLKLPHIHLIGNSEENFYSLGRRDKEGYEQVQNQITQLCMRSQYTAKILKMVTEISDDYTKRGSIDLHKEYKAYADGLEKPVKEVYFNLLLPEIVASFNKWLPNLLGIIPGCSSLFTQDNQNGGIIHSRVLDYAIAGPFEKFERSISYEFTNRLKSFSYSTAGMPFPSLSTINEKGLTLALHYKHGDYFDIKADSIFSIMYQLSSYCTNIHEVKKYLKSHPSMSHWGIYCSDQNGQIGSFDIRGSEVYSEKFDMEEHKFLYFNNRPIINSKDEEEIQPFGNKNQCLMRKDKLFTRMKTYKHDAKNQTLESLKALSTIEPKKSTNAKNWKLDNINPSSIQALSFNNKTLESYYIQGKAPKYYCGNYIHFKNLFSNLEQVLTTKEIKKNSNYYEGLDLLSTAQSSIDNGEVEKAYHVLQMSIVKLEGYPESFVARFFFLIWQYIHEDSNKDLSYIYQDLISLEGKLPEYLNDHRILFLTRLNKILGHGHDQKLRSQIKNSNLKNIFDKEVKMKAVALKLLRKFTIPRIEILDVIYIYA
jgi:hypothetical protein